MGVTLEVYERRPALDALVFQQPLASQTSLPSSASLSKAA